MKTPAVLQKLLLATACLCLSGLFVLTTPAQVSHLSPLVELSQPNPVGGCVDGFLPSAGWGPTESAEPAITVNPAHPDYVVADWTLGRGGDIIAGVSFDGGRSWQRVPIPLTLCSGGPYDGAGDPWLAFGPTGDLYAINGVSDTFLTSISIGVNKSTDGGLHWFNVTIIPGSAGGGARPTISADASDPRFAYALWQGSAKNKNIGLAMFSRTTDGGLTWEPAYPLINPPPQTGVDFTQVFTLPNGTLVGLFLSLHFGINQSPDSPKSVGIIRSADHGQTWSAPSLAIPMWPVLQQKIAASANIDPETGTYVHDPCDPSFAMDPNNGNLYAAWEDGRFSNGQINQIAFSMSSDGGFSWSTPVRVNQTPTNIPLLNQQAFLPSVAVMADGTIGVSHYDFRYNDPSPGLPTDYWLAQCHPSATVSPTNSASWGNEVRLTDTSFNLESVFQFPNEYFLGDYVNALVGSGNGFAAAFTAVDQSGLTSIFGRRVGP
jgi:hypothetical protein